MTSRMATLLAMASAVTVVTSTMGAKPVPRFVWNASASVPIGLYSVQPAGKLAVTNLVVAMPPEPLATFLAERGYLPIGTPLIKRILASQATPCAAANCSSASMESRWAQPSNMIGVAGRCPHGSISAEAQNRDRPAEESRSPDRSNTTPAASKTPADSLFVPRSSERRP